ncbi:AP-1 adapter complex gamma subunit, putative [Trypanosoma brucei gambiense DAL972]|uniref:AP-1 complex subunit gamma n=2 Tax=Trypanosoma brucei TaxID=5691 RepID=C9ZLS4_TRYB9|nr:AP-1 adapter complex gamma subunit, putative [Trypanosoma brucei gambiense DAL972]RHW73022.1 gamma-adaptin 1 [Trypanosoma brucei equiperdum]CBH10349.1 AP-1 adapter complex gamma subunit, putative [Trypanosoma brucei gambiense DAL972]|eukprot:XP_011772639.1 AP-1 adapter complex gamma subunit, putative [Trypanosoma brucei gambiense DAL972]
MNSQKLRELISAVRQCKTSSEERALISKESAIIRESFRGSKPHVRTRNMLKLLYISMLGYPTEFGQVEVVSLIAQSDYAGKRVGYLTIQMVLGENDEVLTLSENHIKKDLGSGQPLLQSMALNVVANIASEPMSRDMFDDILRLFACPDPYIAKKACLAAVRIIKKVPDYAEVFLQECTNVFHENNQAVLLCKLTLVNECLLQSDVEEHLKKYRLATNGAVRLLKQLVLSSRVTAQDIGGVADPFLQIKLLQFMKIVGKGSPVVSETINDVLAQVLTNTDGSTKAGSAVQYECVKTIYAVESDEALRSLGVSTIGRFLASNDNNLRFVALQSLLDYAARDAEAVRGHQDIILDCLKDADVSIRRRALELTVALIDETNVRLLVPDLLTYLTVCSDEMREEVVRHLCQLIETKAPNAEWRVELSLRLLRLGRQHVSVGFATRLIGLLTNETVELQTTATNALWEGEGSPFDAIHHLRKAFLVAAVWCIGEYADLLVSKKGVSEEKIATRIADIINNTEYKLIKSYGLTALVKVASRYPSTKNTAVAVFANHTTSFDCELQQRACEYTTILESFPQEAAFSFERMPPITVTVKDEGRIQAQPLQVVNLPPEFLQKKDTVSLDDLFGGGTAPAGGAPKGAVVNTSDIDDLFGSKPAPAPQAVSGLSALDGLMMASAPAFPAATGFPTATGFPAATAFPTAEKSVFECEDFSVSMGAVVQGTIAISLSILSRLASPMENLSIQVAVPKTSSLEVAPLPMTAVPPFGRIVQSLTVDNSRSDKNPRLVMLRVKVLYTVAGASRSQMLQVSQEV